MFTIIYDINIINLFAKVNLKIINILMSKNKYKKSFTNYVNFHVYLIPLEIPNSS